MTSFSPSPSKNVNSQMASHRESDGDEQELLDFRISEDVEVCHGIHVRAKGC